MQTDMLQSECRLSVSSLQTKFNKFIFLVQNIQLPDLSLFGMNLKRQKYSGSSTHVSLKHLANPLPKYSLIRPTLKGTVSNRQPCKPEKLSAQQTDTSAQLETSNEAFSSETHIVDPATKIQTILQRLRVLQFKDSQVQYLDSLQQQIKEIVSPHIKFRGLVIPVPCDSMGDQLVKNGLFICKVCEWVMHNPFTNQKVLIPRILGLYESAITQNFKDLKQFAVEFSKNNNQYEVPVVEEIIQQMEGTTPVLHEEIETHSKIPQKSAEKEQLKKTSTPDEPVQKAEQVNKKSQSQENISQQPNTPRVNKSKSPLKQILNFSVKSRISQGDPTTPEPQLSKKQSKKQFTPVLSNKVKREPISAEVYLARHGIKVTPRPQVKPVQPLLLGPTVEEKKNALMTGIDKLVVQLLNIKHVYLMEQVEIVCELDRDYQGKGIFRVVFIIEDEKGVEDEEYMMMPSASPKVSLMLLQGYEDKVTEQCIQQLLKSVAAEYESNKPCEGYIILQNRRELEKTVDRDVSVVCKQIIINEPKEKEEEESKQQSQ